MSKLSFQLLIATMFQKDFSLLDKMNVNSNAIIVNQCDEYAYYEFARGEKVIKWFNVKERGLSRSRNAAFSKATADICVLVDDDEILRDNIEELILGEFENNNKVDVITFNLNSISEIKSNRYVNTKRKKLRLSNVMRYGSARLAFRRNKIENARILFNPNFGAGADISCGEDSIFLYDCVKRKLKIYSSPICIADINDDPENSSWFKGITEKYVSDLGAIHYMFGRFNFFVYKVLFIIRKKNITKKFGIKKSFKLLNEGKKRVL